MVRRREVRPEPGEVPPRLYRFRASEWLDESDPPRRPGDDWPDANHIRALRRYMDARAEWAAVHGERPQAPPGYHDVVDPPRRHALPIR